MANGSLVVTGKVYKGNEIEKVLIRHNCRLWFYSAIKTKDKEIWLCEHHCYKQDEQFSADLAAALQVKAFKEVAPKKFRRIVLHSKPLAESSSAVKG